MFNKILVPTDGSDLSDTAIDKAIEFCRKTGAQLSALYVRAHTPIAHPVAFGDYGAGSESLFTPEQVRARLESFGRSVLDRIVAKAAAHGVVCEPILVAGDEPYRAIIETGERMGCGMIFMASHGRRGISAMLLGSETQKVLTHSKLPVLVFR